MNASGRKDMSARGPPHSFSVPPLYLLIGCRWLGDSALLVVMVQVTACILATKDVICQELLVS